MIPLASAVSRVAHLDDDGLRAKAISSVLTGDFTGVREFSEEEPEDVFVPLLAPGSPRRAAVLAGCRDLCAQLLFLIINPKTASAPETTTIVAHFTALVGAARPRELQHQIRSLLELVLDPSVPANIRDSIVSLAVDYATDETDADYWQRHLEGDVIPSQALQALLNIDPRHPRVERALVDLWIRSLRNRMSIKMPFAVQRWASSQSAPDTAIGLLITRIIQTAPDVRTELEADCLRYRHSRNWFKLISEVELEPTPFARFQTKSGKTDLTDASAIAHLTRTVAEQVETSAWSTSLLDSPSAADIIQWYKPRRPIGRELFRQHRGAFSVPTIARLTTIKVSGQDLPGRTLHRLVLSHEDAELEYEIWIDTALKTFTNNLITQLAEFSSTQDILKKA